CCAACRRCLSRTPGTHSLKASDREESIVRTPQTRLSPHEVRQDVACMCDHGYACSSFAPGHALHLIQARMASATPLGWADALVEDADAASGVLILRTL